MFEYKYPHPAVTVDIIILRNVFCPITAGRIGKLNIFGSLYKQQEVLLIKRGSEPFKDCWALPGGHAEPNETLEAAAARELYEETNVANVKLVQKGTYSDPGRDPRGWYITVVYSALVPAGTTATAGDDAKETRWFPVRQLPENLAFDHGKILKDVILA